MRKLSLSFAGFALLSLAVFAQDAQAWGVRIGIGVPLYVGPGPYYGYGYPYGYPYPYYAPSYVVPPPAVVYQQAPTVIAAPPPAPVVTRSISPTSDEPPPIVSPAPAPVTVTNSSPKVMPILHESTLQIDGFLQKLGDPNETTRRDAALDLGRLNADGAVDALVSVMKKDASPIARDGAARALGLIAAPRSLTALIYTAQADNDREVRHSAQFAVEVIRNKLKGQ